MWYTQFTAVISVLCCLVALRGSRGGAVGLLIAVCVFWPEYLRVAIGPANMSAPRFMAIILILRAFWTGTTPRPYYPDYLILVFWAWQTVCSYLNDNVAGPMTFRVGVFLDTVNVYWAVRCCIRSGDDLIRAVRWLVYAGVVSGVLGMLETTETWWPYRGYIQLVIADSPFFMNYTGEGANLAQFPLVEHRMGLMRSYGSALTHIAWGTTALVLLGLMIPVVRDFMAHRRMTPFLWVGLAGAALGLFSSLSAGPWAATIIMIGVLCIRRWTFLVIPVSSGIAVVLLIVSLVSGTPPWYPAFRMIGLDANTSWYRSELLTYIFTKINEYGLMGCGAEVFDQWARELDGRAYLDVANHYLMVGLQSGVLGILLQVLISVVIIFHQRRLYLTGGPRQQLYSYCQIALLTAFTVNAISVTYSDLMSVLLYILYGIGMMDETAEEVSPELMPALHRAAYAATRGPAPGAAPA